jgi:Flp pilus assembly protein TadG
MSKGLTARTGNARGHGGAVRVMRRLRARLRDEHGQAITELAIVLPVLLLILLGILDFGRAVNDWNDETHVANLAARFAAVGSLPTYGKCGTNTLGSGATLTQFIDCEVGIDSQALQNGSGGGNGPTPVNATVCVPTNTQVQSVTVNVTTSYQWIPYLGITTTTSPVTGSATQEIEDPNGVPSAWITSTSC